MTIIQQLQEALAASRLERSEFGRLHPQSYRDALPYPKNENEVTAFIKERVALHHKSWISDPLAEILRKLGAPEA